jgi:hypothetical protein
VILPRLSTTYLFASGEHDLVVGSAENSSVARLGRMGDKKIACGVRILAIPFGIEYKRDVRFAFLRESIHEQ